MAYKTRTLSTRHWRIVPEYFRADGILHGYFVVNHGSTVVIHPDTWRYQKPLRLGRSDAAKWLNDMRKLGKATRCACGCLS